jgi:uncharacterized LabA/DUF88 family protein
MSFNAHRVSFYVDGFNLYHSLKSAEKVVEGRQVKWLNLMSLCSSYLHMIGGNSELAEVHYFTAYAYHLDKKAPDKIERHKAFVRALTATRVKEHISHFQKKDVWDTGNERWVKAYEEKETDVLLACTVIKDATQNRYDSAVVISADSDFVPLIQTLTELFPQKCLHFAFPFDRVSKDLKKRASNSFTISKEAYLKHQLPDKVQLPSGKYVTIPKEWK